MQVHGKSNDKWIILTVVALALVATVFWLFRSPSSEFSAQTKAEFIESCLEVAGDENYCGCSYDELTSRLSPASYDELNRRMIEGRTTGLDNELLNQVASTCAISQSTL